MKYAYNGPEFKVRAGTWVWKKGEVHEINPAKLSDKVKSQFARLGISAVKPDPAPVKDPVRDPVRDRNPEIPRQPFGKGK